jgi:hypothetical protein
VFGVLAGRRINVLAASVGQPSLDDVFLRETGRSLRDAGGPDAGPDAGPDSGPDSRPAADADSAREVAA